MRLFIAINLPNWLRAKLVQFQSELKKVGIKGKFVEKENIHLTLKFLGETSNIEQISKKIEQVCARFSSFEASLRGIGGFPSKSRPRIIWAGLGLGAEAARALHIELERALTQLGFPRDSRYENHITLVRVKNITDKLKLAMLFERYADFEFGHFKIDRIALMSSILRKCGPVYRVVKEFLLKER